MKELLAQKYNLDLDKKFIEIPNTGRGNLAEFLGEAGCKVGAEIGVLGGVYSRIICESIPGVKLYGIDPWLEYKPYYRDWKSQRVLNYWYEQAKASLKDFDVTLIRKTSMDALKDFEDESLDFVYIDGNHEIPYILDDICWWRRKVKVGGAICGHDYRPSLVLDSRMHVPQAVNCAVDCYRIKNLFIWGRRRCPVTETRDRARSWMFFREW